MSSVRVLRLRSWMHPVLRSTTAIVFMTTFLDIRVGRQHLRQSTPRFQTEVYHARSPAGFARCSWVARFSALDKGFDEAQHRRIKTRGVQLELNAHLPS